MLQYEQYFFLFFILHRYKFLIYKFTNSTMNLNHTLIKIDGNILMTLLNSVKPLVSNIQLIKNWSSCCQKVRLSILTVLVTNLWYSNFALSETVAAMVLELINLDRTFSKTVSKGPRHFAINTDDKHLIHLAKQDKNGRFLINTFSPENLQPHIWAWPADVVIFFLLLSSFIS